ncbi:hypothetical protein ACT8ZR_11860 [Neobacillus sp. M.A.Huq-85]|nr:hypothetical protein QNK12_29130 [Neobacillus cucumis]
MKKVIKRGGDHRKAGFPFKKSDLSQASAWFFNLEKSQLAHKIGVWPIYQGNGT